MVKGEPGIVILRNLRLLLQPGALSVLQLQGVGQAGQVEAAFVTGERVLR